MTCQVCNRPILANTGSIAHHGYQRPCEGFQTRSCSGAKQLPFEVSRNALAKEIDFARVKLVSLRDIFVAVENETKDIPYTFDDKTAPQDRRGRIGKKTMMVNRSSFAEADAYRALVARYRNSVKPSFDRLKAHELSSLAYQIDNTAGYIKMQTERFDAWTMTHKRDADQWVYL
jgi:hypothetical protein